MFVSRFAAGAVVLVAIALLLSPSKVSATSGWKPYRTPPFDLPAGARCPFPLSGRTLQDQERIRTLATFPDGSPQRQEVVGRLVVRYVNQATGAHVDRNLTGTAFVDYRLDGSSTLTLRGGHFAVGLAATDPGGPAFLVLSGHGHAVTFAPDGGRTLALGTGRVENICRTLAG